MLYPTELRGPEFGHTMRYAIADYCIGFHRVTPAEDWVISIAFHGREFPMDARRIAVGREPDQDFGAECNPCSISA